jgi:hypothetical protein
MSGFKFFETHRTWEDWGGMALGLLIVLSPWITGEANHGFGQQSEPGFAILNAVAVGILVFGLAQMEYIALQRWEEFGEMVLGLWLAVSPHVLNYSGDGVLRFWHTFLGGLVILLAALKLWQDWELTDQDLARHGQ